MRLIHGQIIKNNTFLTPLPHSSPNYMVLRKTHRPPFINIPKFIGL